MSMFSDRPDGDDQRPEEQPGPDQRRKARRTLFWIVGILAAVAVLCCAGGITLIARTATRSSTAEGADAGGQAPDDLPGTGTPARDGKLEFTVKKVECGQTSVGPSGYAENASGQFCVATLSVRNVGNATQTYFSDNQVALGPNGTEFKDDLAATRVLALQNGQEFSKNLNPGAAIDTAVVFDVPKDANLEALVLHDSEFSDGTQVRVS